MEQQHEKLKPIGKWTVQDIEELPQIELDWLEFKAGKWLSLESNLQELSKYLSAFANFDGGYLIIGATNPSSGKPPNLDEGVDFAIKRDLQGWLEDKLPPLTDPKLPKIQIQPIPLAPNEARWSIYVPRSSEAPHQAQDHRYYTRIGTKLRDIGNQAVLDILNRRRHPVVQTHIFINLDRRGDRHKVLWRVTNLSDVFVRHVMTRIQVPININGQCINFDGGSMLVLDSAGTTVWPLIASNHLGQPLFPRGFVVQEFEFETGDLPFNRRTLPSHTL
jgi:hypothetical protein